MTNKEDIIIVGAGLSGLTLAYLLSKENIDAKILEASPRIGGRIQTIKGENETPLELGATWFSNLHPNLLSLVEELGLEKYPQYSKGISLFQTKSFEPPQRFFVPEAETPSYRLAGGTQKIIDSLASKLNDGSIHLNTKVENIKYDEKNGFMVETNQKTYLADRVILAVPPQLVSTINFEPTLPEELSVILPTVQTWMAGALKFTLEYPEPFWKRNGYSGMLYSHAGIVVEMYDHTNFAETKFGFTGFLNGGCAGYSKEVRKELVLKQLTDLLGKEAATPLAYYDKVWTDQYILAGQQIIQRPHQNNGHPSLNAAYMDGKMFLCATETAREFPGYMEGAIIAADNVYRKLLM